MLIPNNIQAICKDIHVAGGEPLIVGGAVRDHLMGEQPKDFDIEVGGMNEAALVQVLQRWGRVNLVGSDFGVIKVWLSDGQELDFSLPRRERKIKSGRNHRDFIIEIDPEMSIEERMARRDFTMNAIGFNPITGDIIDPFDGQIAILIRQIVPTSERVKEDPIRVLRAMQFAARFNMTISRWDMLRQMRADFFKMDENKRRDRSWIEWEKWASKGKYPSAGLKLLQRVGWLDKELDLVGVPQDPRHHPEGDAWNHVGEVVDWMHRICEREEITGVRRLALMFAALLHDCGKKTHTQIHPDGRITSHGHEEAGVEPAQRWMENNGVPKLIQERVLPLVRHHMAGRFGDQPSPAAIRRLALKVDLRDLILLIEADCRGRGQAGQGVPAQVREMMRVAKEIHVFDRQPEPILKGRHLIERGMKPSPQFKVILDAAFEAQLDGQFSNIEGAQEWLDGRQ